MYLPEHLPVGLSADTHLDGQTFSSFATQNATVSEGTSVSLHATRAVASRLGDPMMPKTRSRTGLGKAGALAGFASVMAILFAVLVCRYSHYHKTEPLIAGRQLSSNGDSSDESCMAFGGKTFTASQQIAAEEVMLKLPLEKAGLPPAAKLARLDTGDELGETSSEAAHGKSGMLRASVPRHAPSGFQAGAASSGYGSASGRTREELEAASALLELQQLPEARGQPATSSQPFTGYAFPTAGSLSSTSSAGALEQPAPSPTSLSSSHVLLDVTSSLTEKRDADLRASSQLDMSVVGGPLCLHPFFRLPAANPADLQAPRFSPFLALSVSRIRRPVTVLLKDLRELLVEHSLTQQGLNQLADVTHTLMAAAYCLEGASMATKSRKVAAIVLGRRFLVMDGLLSALHVLGETASGNWWEKFTLAINHDNSQGVMPKRRSAAALFNEALLQKLVGGILHLKTGARMSPAETVLIKRMLFCSPHSPAHFKQSYWDMWRTDDENFRSSTTAGNLDAPPQR